MLYVVLDDALFGNGRGWTPDNFAELLRTPLEAVGVKVLRRQGEGQMSCRGGLQARGCSADAYEAKLDQVEEIVNGVLTRGPA